MKSNANISTAPSASNHSRSQSCEQSIDETRTTASGSMDSRPVLKPWMTRILLGAGIPVPPDGSERERLAWLGVEMQRFLGFSRTLPLETSLLEALESYGQNLKSRQPALEEWRMEQAREALRAFRKGSEGWQVVDGEKGREVRVRAKSAEGHSPTSGSGEAEGA
ncbi:MAG: hypothetical protein ABL994_20265 [Verrucomicrobiales bacterium]